MAPTVVRKNERSWAIDMITTINGFCNNNDLVIKRAGGENTVSTEKNRMFPDLILYGDSSQSLILQGWEIKMPDVPINDITNIKDAQRKANALKLNSCLIWNFTHAVLYIKNELTDEFEIVKKWSDTDYIKTRDDVKTYEKDWTALLIKIIQEVNEYFVKDVFRNIAFQDIISSSIIATLIKRNKKLVSKTLEDDAIKNSIMEAYLDDWWNRTSFEYINDEQNKYDAYAKTILLNWANRICFAHIIKKSQKTAFLIDGFNETTTPDEVDNIFSQITKVSDFYNIFTPIIYNKLLPQATWRDIFEFSNFLKNTNFQNLDQKVLQNIMEETVNEARRQINGQFTTPYSLARILSKLTIINWHSNVIDCCCGTGTIARAVLDIKKNKISTKEAVNTVWACDKYSYLLQIANISLANIDTVKLANRIFKHNALNLETGEIIEIINPENGVKESVALPKFDNVISNLPFIHSSNIPKDDTELINSENLLSGLDGRLDLYGYITIKLSDIVKIGGRVGVILSNSWLGTSSGDNFIENLLKQYNILQVHTSGNGRWFDNADVVATILILEKKDGNLETSNNTGTDYILWKKPLKVITENYKIEQNLINSSILRKRGENDDVAIFNYSEKEASSLLTLGISRNALFYDVGWLRKVEKCSIPIGKVFDVIRGSRRGWDDLFFPNPEKHKIEKKFLKPVLKNARNCEFLVANADADAFCCSDSIEQLIKDKNNGTVEWINNFKDIKNGVGKPLPEVLATNNNLWYELKDNETVDYFTSINPDTRLFFGMFKESTFINQRLVGLKLKDETLDKDLYHALLNSMFTMFFIEASGFGRGLGVLDINKDKISHCRILNPLLLDIKSKKRIIDSFETIKNRKILKTVDELNSDDRVKFEKVVFESFGLSEIFENVKKSLLNMQISRKSVATKESK